MKIEIEVPDGKKAEWVNGVLTLVDEKPKDITEQIKTLSDALAWCENNNEQSLKVAWGCTDFEEYADTQDIVAYLKLRIITCALNEGWEPKLESDTCRYRVVWDAQDSKLRVGMCSISEQLPKLLLFRTRELAEYAAKQFRDIYIDFFGVGEGGEE